MEQFKRILAIPLWLTVVWLLWVLGQQVGLQLQAWIMAALVLLGSAVALLRIQRICSWALLAICALWLWMMPALPTPSAAQQAPTASIPQKEVWTPWSPALQAQLLSQGKPFFIDYTAAWCVTCQYNKYAVLSDPDVLAAFAMHQVTLLRADWTRYDATITQALGTLGRSGVPVYVLYNKAGEHQLLPELLQKQHILDALKTLAQP
jgi:thiol:disulfide interchange protein DsbD